MENTENGFSVDWSQEVDDLIDSAVGDLFPIRAVKRMEKAINQGLPGTKNQRANAYMVLGTRYEDLHRSDKAIECYDQAIQLYVDNPICYYWRGELLYKQGQYEKARMDFETALSYTAPNELYSPERENAQDFIKKIDQASR